MKFKAKPVWLLRIILGIFVILNIVSIAEIFRDFDAAVILFVTFFTVFNVFLAIPFCFFSYRLDEDRMVIKMGFYRYGRIKYDLIERVARERYPGNIPTLSLDRLEIIYRRKAGSFLRIIYISPKDMDNFQKQLHLKLNKQYKGVDCNEGFIG
jgi:hypothetical protein